MGGHHDCFWRLYKRYGLRGGRETLGAVEETEVSGGSAEGNFGSDKGAAATGICQVWREQGRVEGGKHRQ